MNSITNRTQHSALLTIGHVYHAPNFRQVVRVVAHAMRTITRVERAVTRDVRAIVSTVSRSCPLSRYHAPKEICRRAPRSCTVTT